MPIDVNSKEYQKARAKATPGYSRDMSAFERVLGLTLSLAIAAGVVVGVLWLIVKLIKFLWYL